MAKVTTMQLKKLLDRCELPEGHRAHISREALQAFLGRVYFIVPDTLLPLPTFAELMRRFDGHVNESFDGAKPEPYGVHGQAPYQSADDAFEYFSVSCKKEVDELLAEMDEDGVRPATYEEFLAFAKAYPDEPSDRSKWCTIALGSLMTKLKGHNPNYKAFAGIMNSSGKRKLALWDAKEVCNKAFNFLVVRFRQKK